MRALDAVTLKKMWNWLVNLEIMNKLVDLIPIICID